MESTLFARLKILNQSDGNNHTATNIIMVPVLLFFAFYPVKTVAVDVIPSSPVEIGETVQFLFDNYIVENHWAVNYKKETVRRVFHPGTKYQSNPVIAEETGYISVMRDEKTGLFKMWYQTYLGPRENKWHEYVTSYAESRDGVSWTLPKLGLIEVKGSKENNVVWKGAHKKWKMGEAPYIIDVPEEFRRGYRYVMFYHDVRFEGDVQSLNLVGSHDGIHWDRSSVTKLTSIPSDTHNAIVYDPKQKLFVMYLRARPIYAPFHGNKKHKGHSRRVARMTNKKLWTRWSDSAQNILIPDEADVAKGYSLFYGMPVKYYAGIYWGFLWPYRPDQYLHTELAWSRDGIRFDRLTDRPKLIERGKDGDWDDGSALSANQWIEVGDEWWVYYCGNDEPHNAAVVKTGVGLVKFRKEGFISLRGPSGGGFVATRKIQWTGGKLLVNADAKKGEMQVRVTDENRKVIPGFDYSDCNLITTDSVAHEVSWKEKKIKKLRGRIIRLEFALKNVDLYTFKASQ